MFPLRSDRGGPQPGGIGLLTVLWGLSLGLLCLGADEKANPGYNNGSFILQPLAYCLGELQGLH